ncbi:TVP38/TMEM64 family protein [Corynebacterium liangguodongii]|uniref:TVP38/TMEM64 family membrane protein n=1 Tax=Corynebacterium liangguodongii TaxID=2079535 RepID=A0A2S0WED2_9CORY|nr:TVP38/TMEM64 family protein [Corynebacterium liangguodongii]AWB84022.1 TVP38/TMEM64 family protein [Corynebacterium liangguodongii]PWC00034.1 TVP38/TMEM64 family protein [Corynebacterium liangguodongii]
MARWRIPLLALALVALVAAWQLFDAPSLAILRHWADETGAWFPVVFWLLYVLITQFPIPRTVMTVSAGILFGTLWGILIALTATTVSSVLSLLVVRYLARDIVEAHVRDHPAVERINLHLERRGWVAIASLRLIAIVPFSLLNYAAALTRVHVVPFAAATLVGSAPNTVVVALFGDALTGGSSPIVLVAMGVAAVVGVVGLAIDALIPARSPTQSPSRGAEVNPLD